MSIDVIGTIGDPATRRQVEAWLQERGQSEQFARYNVAQDLVTFADQDTVVVMAEGVPLILDESETLPFACNCYAIYRDHYLDVLEQLGGTPVPGISYPLLPEGATSKEAMLRSAKSYRPHIIGAKSQQVAWNAVPPGFEMNAVVADLDAVFVQHTQDMDERWEVGAPASALMIDGWRMFSDMTDSRVLMVAHHVDTGSPVAAMQVYTDQAAGVIDCANIAIRKEDRWKPYGLTVAAQIAAACWALEEGYATVNFGLNPPGLGDYKAQFARMDDVVGVSNRDLLLYSIR